MDAITEATQRFFAEADAYWLAHPGRVLPIIAADEQRALVARVFWLRELTQEKWQPFFVFDESFTSTSSYFHRVADTIADEYESIRAWYAWSEVEVPSFASEEGVLPNGPIECAASAMERASHLLGHRVESTTVALVPEHVASPRAWLRGVRALAARRWSSRSRVGVLLRSGDPLDDLGGSGVHFQLHPDALFGFGMGTEQEVETPRYLRDLDSLLKNLIATEPRAARLNRPRDQAR